MRRLHAHLTFLVALLTVAGAAHAAISRHDKKEAKHVFSGPLYLRMDAPCTQGRHPFGVFYSPLVKVSPSGTEQDAEEGSSFGWYHAESTVWPLHVNDQVELDDIDWDEDEASVEIELDGKGPAEDQHSVIEFVDVHSLGDFKAAFDRAFSHKPLQEEHPEWPEKIRQAIAERHLMNGMNKRQAYYIVGTPARVEKTKEGDALVEVWTLHRKGIRFGFFSVKTGGMTEAPQSLRFEDGALVSASTSTSEGGLDLDNP